MAAIAEELEVSIAGSNGAAEQTLYSYWVTRDGFRQQGDEWLVTSSEAIGHENWEPGKVPPMDGW